jgi:hypothetical protein
MRFREKIINQVRSDFGKMSSYERWRLMFQILQIVITLGVPFLVVWLNKNWD